MDVDFTSILGADRVLDTPDDRRHYGADWSKHYQANPSLVLLPKSAEEVQELLRVANDKRIAIVPSGGRTGLSAGATATNGEVVLSLEKLNAIGDVNIHENAVVVGAGAVLERVQEAARRAGLFYPVDLGPRGSCQIGGNIATNAGGNRVLRYGGTRNWVLDVEVVFADGTRESLNGSLYKNNTGYDLRQLMIGSEGTLGVIVAATLALTTPPKDRR
ncbi:MAG: FAD-binding oxidoreductase, partial [Bdellovibrionales bacterium]|nr:FAD-binding oxidoreductase [Bdellovibrionales bacterium]